MSRTFGSRERVSQSVACVVCRSQAGCVGAPDSTPDFWMDAAGVGGDGRSALWPAICARPPCSVKRSALAIVSSAAHVIFSCWLAGSVAEPLSRCPSSGRRFFLSFFPSIWTTSLPRSIPPPPHLVLTQQSDRRIPFDRSGLSGLFNSCLIFCNRSAKSLAAVVSRT